MKREYFMDTIFNFKAYCKVIKGLQKGIISSESVQSDKRDRKDTVKAAFYKP